jgi:biotin transporter BioY
VGVPWLGLNLLLVQEKKLGFQALLMMGMVPFLPGDILKIFLASWLIGPVERTLSHIRGR